MTDAEKEARCKLLERKLTEYEETAQRLALLDLPTVEALRRSSWARVGAPIGPEKFVSRGWPCDTDAQQEWRLSMSSPMTHEQQWNSPTSLRAREQDRADMALRDRLAAVEAKEKKLAEKQAREAQLSAPATEAEIQALDTARIISWIRHAGIDLDNIAQADNLTFAKALVNCPASGWPNGQTEAKALRDLRTATLAPEPEASAVTVADTALGRMLAAL